MNKSFDDIPLLLFRYLHQDIKSNNSKWNEIIKTYQNILSLSTTDKIIPFCRLSYNFYGKGKNVGRIFFRLSVIKNPTEDDLTDLLHEIGHIITNKPKMKRCLEEYLATQWAIDNASKFNVKFSNKRICEFQKYIYETREKNIRNNSKNVPTKEQLRLIV